MALVDNMLTMMAGMKPENISVHEERCVCIRNRNANCLKCVEVCTTGAIAYEANDLQVHPEKCIGCGTCANACPTGALEVAGLSDDELTLSVKQTIRATKGHPVIACQHAYDAAKHQIAAEAKAQKGARFAFKKNMPRLDENAICVVPCLGRLDESIFIGMGAFRSYDVTLVCNNCEQCEHATGGAFVRKVAEDAQRMVAAFGRDMPISFVSEFPNAVILEPGEQGSAPAKALASSSRRQALVDAKNAGAELARESLNEALGDTPSEPVPVAYRKVDPRTGTLSHFVPTRRTRMYNYLKHIGEPVVDEVQTRVVGKVSIDADRCTSCRMCAVFCPTGAIFKVDEPECFGIFHRPAACMQCRLCESLCHEGAITIEDRIPIKQFMGQKGILYEMPRPEWKPNEPDSMFNKVHNVLGEDLPMRAF